MFPPEDDGSELDDTDLKSRSEMEYDRPLYARRDETLAEGIAAATAAYGVTTWPEATDEATRSTFLYDLTISSLVAFIDLAGRPAEVES